VALQGFSRPGTLPGHVIAAVAAGRETCGGGTGWPSFLRWSEKIKAATARHPRGFSTRGYGHGRQFVERQGIDDRKDRRTVVILLGVVGLCDWSGNDNGAAPLGVTPLPWSVLAGGRYR